MSTHPLEPQQEELLGVLASAWRAKREEFHTQFGDDQWTLYHAGLTKNAIPINIFDIDALAGAGFIRITNRTKGGEPAFAVTKAGLDMASQSSDHPLSEAKDKRVVDLNPDVVSKSQMDYVAWCGKVLEILLQTQESSRGQFFGLRLDQMTRLIFGEETDFYALTSDSRGQALMDAYQDLKELGLIEDVEIGTLKIPRQRRDEAQDQSNLWLEIAQIALDADEQRLLRLLNHHSEHRETDHAYIEEVPYDTLIEDGGGEPTYETRHETEALLADLESQGLAKRSQVIGDLTARATYAGLARQYRAGAPVLDYLSTNRQMSVEPIWVGRDFVVDEHLCFVVMPFQEALTEVYQDHVKPTVEVAGLKCVRADDIYSTSPIMEDIWEQICRARVIVAELTGRNPNVFYEIGIAHTLGKPIIFLTQSIEDVPFDLKHRRCITYQPSSRGGKLLEESLAKTLQSVLMR